MKTIAFIPARCGSQSISLKNIKPFCGKPLLYWSAKALQDTPHIDEIVIATDCSEIEETVLQFQFSKLRVYQRKAQNATNTASTESVMLEYIEHAQLADDITFILVQATSPLMQSKDFVEALKLYEQSDSLLSGVRVKRFYWNDKGEPLNYDYRNRPRRQDFDGQLMENGAFYINSVSNIIQDQNRLSGKVSIYEMPFYTEVELDEPDDWMIAEKMMQKYILPNHFGDKKIKLLLTDVDGVLTDAGMYYSENGDELKKFNTHDGKGVELVRKAGIRTGVITSENTKLVNRRAKKLKFNYIYQGKDKSGKLAIAKVICTKEGITLNQVAYIGDDVNCYELLSHVGIAACPSNALKKIKDIPGILQLQRAGGEGAFREFVDYLFENKHIGQ